VISIINPCKNLKLLFQLIQEVFLNNLKVFIFPSASKAFFVLSAWFCSSPSRKLHRGKKTAPESEKLLMSLWVVGLKVVQLMGHATWSEIWRLFSYKSKLLDPKIIFFNEFGLRYWIIYHIRYHFLFINWLVDIFTSPQFLFAIIQTLR
jgi:hypothetical protein